MRSLSVCVLACSLSLLMGMVASGCDGGPAVPAGPVSPGASALQLIDGRTVLSNRCGGCHNANNPQSGLDLASERLAARVVNQPSSGCKGFVLADPVDPESSLIYRKLTSDPGCGEVMPPAGMTGPSPEEKLAIRDWISGLSVAAAGECTPRATRPCQVGNPEWWSVCPQPEQACSADGQRWGECVGALPGIENCTTEADDDCNPGTPAHACSETAWSFSVARDRKQLFESVDVDAEGNVFVLGHYAGIANFGDGELASDQPEGQYKHDVFLGKYDKFGTPIWTKDFGDSSNQYGPRIAVHPKTGNIAVLVRLFGSIDFGDGAVRHTQKGSGDVVVAVLNADGKHLWSHLLGSRAKDRAERIAWSPGDGDLIVTGKTGHHPDRPMVIPGKGAIDPRGQADAFVIRFGPMGDVRWHALLGGGNLVAGERSVRGTGDSCDPKDGNHYRRCKGCGAQRCDPETRTWSAECSPRQSSEGSLLFPCTRLDLACSREKDTSGLCVSGDDDYAWGGVADASGDVYVAGRFEGWMTFARFRARRQTVERAARGSRDIFVVKLDGATGNPIWSQHFGGAGDDRAYDVAIQPRSGKVIVTGYFTGTVGFGGKRLSAEGGERDDDFFVLSLHPESGATEWARSFGDESSQFGHEHEFAKTTRQLSLEIDDDDHIYLGGSLYGSFGGRLRAARGAEGPRPDPFFAKLSPRGNYLNGRVHGSRSSEFGADIALEPNTGAVLMVGSMSGDRLDFGSSGEVLGIKNEVDAWIAKFPRP